MRLLLLCRCPTPSRRPSRSRCSPDSSARGSLPPSHPGRAAAPPHRASTAAAGSGKTTLLNELLKSAAAGSLRVGVLVNEFGSIDIDSSLVDTSSSVASGTVQLANGCVCCTINGSLLDALSQLLADRGRSLDALVLETSGVADPEPILETLRQPELAASVRLDAVVTVADAGRVAASASASASAFSSSSGGGGVGCAPGAASVEVPLEESAWGEGRSTPDTTASPGRGGGSSRREPAGPKGPRGQPRFAEM